MHSVSRPSAATHPALHANRPRGSLSPYRVTLLPTQWLIASEGIDPKRASEVRRQILLDEGILQPLQVGLLNSRFIVLDGHNRLRALQRLRLRHAPVQIHRGRIDVSTWVLGSSSEIGEFAGLEHVSASAFSTHVDWRGGIVALRDGSLRLFPTNPRQRLIVQRAVVRALSANAGQKLARHEDHERGDPKWWTRLKPSRARARTIVIYPRITMAEFCDIVIQRKQKVPAGATRFRLNKVLFDSPLSLNLFVGWHSLREARLRFDEVVAQRDFSIEVPR